MQQKNFYTLLAVSETASLKEIKTAYRRLAKKHHPDKNLGNKKAEEDFKEILHAYLVLSNSLKRREYDKLLNLGAYNYERQYTPYATNPYQYAQKTEYKNSKPNTETDTKQPLTNKVEMYQWLMSIIIAMIFLYFIISYKF